MLYDLKGNYIPNKTTDNNNVHTCFNSDIPICHVIQNVLGQIDNSENYPNVVPAVGGWGLIALFLFLTFIGIKNAVFQNVKKKKIFLTALYVFSFCHFFGSTSMAEFPADYYGTRSDFNAYLEVNFERWAEQNGYLTCNIRFIYDRETYWRAKLNAAKRGYACSSVFDIEGFYSDADQDGIGDTDDMDGKDESLINEKDFGFDTVKGENGICPFVSNPINILNGNNFESQVDFIFKSPSSTSLKFERYYNSQKSIVKNYNSGWTQTMGMGWRHSYDFELDPDFEGSPILIKIIDATGRGYFFEDYNGDAVFQGLFLENSIVSKNDSENFVWTRNGMEYVFHRIKGVLLSITDKNGNIQTLTYNATTNLLETVTDQASGRALTFHYNIYNRIEYITGPVTTGVPHGIWASYTYDDNGNLTHVTYADDNNGSTASGFEYRYEDPNAPTLPDAVNNLTGKYDLAGNMISTWEYDDQDRAFANTHRKDKDVTIDYSEPGQVSVTDAYGIETIYQISDVATRKKISSKTNEGGCNTCSEGIKDILFDPVTGYPAERTFFNGKVEEYQDYDANFNPQTINTYEEDEFGERTLINTTTMTYHPVLSTPLTIRRASLLNDTSHPDREKQTVFDYDDPTADGDTNIANEVPTNLIHRRVEKGYTLDSSGAVIPFEYTTRYTYNAKGQVRSIDGPRNGTDDTLTFFYDWDANNTWTLQSITTPLPGSQAGTGTITLQHDAASNITSVTDLNGVVSSYTYDGSNRQLSSTTNGKTSSQLFNVAGTPTSFTDKSGRITTWMYNLNGLVEKIIETNGEYLFFGYDSNANRIEESIYTAQAVLTHTQKIDFGDPSTNSDLAPGHPWQALQRDQEDTTDLATAYTYEHGRVKTITDPEGLVTTLGYDVLDRVRQVTRTKAEVVEDTTLYAYDTHDNLIQITDAEDHLTSYQYDDMDRLVRTTSPDTGTTTYAYDEAGNMTVKKQSTQEVSFNYDVLNRLTRVSYPGDTTQNVTLIYDEGIYGKGRLTSIEYLNHATDPLRVCSFIYDPWGFLVEKNQKIFGTLYRIGYGYDADGRLTSIEYPSGKTVHYHLDISGRPKQVSISEDQTPQTIADQITYYPFGPLKSLQFNNGKILNVDTDLNYRSRTQTVSGLMELGYSRDDVGNVDVIYDYLDSTSARDEILGYDNLYRLESSIGPHGQTGFTYDDVGNRQTKTVDSVTDTYSYFQGTNLLNEITGLSPLTFSYDENGNIEAIGTRIFEYDDNNRLIKEIDTGPDPDIVLGEYGYNFFGQRISKTVNGSTTIYHYDLDGNLIAETDPEGTVIKEYVYLEGQPLAMLMPNPATYTPTDLDQDSDVDGKDLASFTGSDLSALALEFGTVYTLSQQVYYYHTDHLGTPVMMTDDDGNIAWQVDYSPFGNVDINVEVVVNNLRFPGQYYDAETGLHYNWHRYYDPETGRYLTPDPIGLAGGINPFVYVEANPINSIDPLGLLNLTKTGVGFVNSFRGVTGVGAGVVVIGAGTATIPLFGDVVATPAYVFGSVKLATGFANFNKGMGQIREAVDEPFAAASFRNLLGLAPFGQKFDDPCEPGPREYFKGIWNDYIKDPISTAKRAIKDFFAFD